MLKGLDHRRSLLLSALVLLIAVRDAGAQFALSAGSSFSVGTAPSAIVTADFNGDGKPDIATANSNGNSVTIFLSNGAGGFSPGAGSPVAMGASPQSLAVADFNGDGKLDLVIANFSSSNITILLGNGAGKFTPAAGSPFALGASPTFIAVGDFNGDGKVDIATANSAANSITVLLGNGAGGFAPSSGSPVAVGQSPYSLVIGDVNGDGKQDIVAANYAGNNVIAFIGSGTGAFTAVASGPIAVGSLPISIVLADLNGDHKLDIVTANSGDNTVTLLLGDGLGGFTAPSGGPVSVGSRPSAAAVADFNGDGIPDFVTANSVDNTATVFFGNGSGGFTAATGNPFAVGATPVALGIADFNQDGKPDIAIANAGGKTVTVQLNNLPAITASLSSVTFYAGVGQAAPIAIPVRLTSATAGSTFTATPNKLWVVPAPASAATGAGATVSLSADPTSLTAGAYSGTVRYIAPNFFGAATGVTLNVTNPSGTLQSAAGSPFATGPSPQFIGVADLNGDGHQDLVTANYGGNSITILLGDGTGAFSENAGSPIAVGANPAALAVADFDGDGNLDIAVANSGSNSITVLLGNGSGAFTPSAGSPYAVGGEPLAMTVGDFNRDGQPDIITANNSDQTLTVLLGTGTGGFAVAPGNPVALGFAPVSVASGDFDGDGRPDIVTASFNGKVTVYFGNGAGGFILNQSFPVGSLPQSVVVADLNADGRLDLVTANSGSNTVSILLGDGSGNFAAAPGSPVAAGSSPESVAVLDVNGDGKPDILTADIGDDTVRVLLGNGSGGFTAASGSPIAAGATPLSLVSGDFNGDGRPDIAVTNVSVSTITVLLGKQARTSSVLSTTIASTIAYGSSVPLILRVSMLSGGVGSPAGSATFLDGGTAIGAATQTVTPYSFSAVGLAGGVHTLTAIFGGDNASAASTSNTLTVTVTPSNQSITFAALPAKAFQSAPLTVTATASSGLPVGIASLTTSVCTVSATAVTLLSTGTCTLEATQPGNGNYKAATPVDQTFRITPATQTITFGALPNIAIGNPPFDVAATATSGLPVTFVSTTLPVCTVAGATVTLVNGGACAIQATQTGNATYTAATAVTQRFQVTPASQTIIFGPLSDQSLGAAPITLAATASSGLAVTVASTTASVCKLAGTTLTLITTGLCSVKATQAGNAGYSAATSVTQSFSVAPGTQSITFNALSGKSFGNAPFTVGATASSGLAVAFTSISPAVCTVAVATVTLTGTGSCTVEASQAGNANYSAATPVDQSFMVAQGSQTITFAALQNKPFSNTPVTVSASASSGLAVTFASPTPVVCGVNGNSIVLVGAGTCTIEAGQSGSANYAAATSVSQSFTVAPGSQSITFGAIANQPFGAAPFSITATASSGLPVTLTSGTLPVCTVTGTTVSVISVGACTIQASQAGDSTFAAAPSVNQRFTVTPASQTLSFGGAFSNLPLGTPPFSITATASSGLTVSLASTTIPVCTLSGGALTLVAAGTCTVQATQKGNTNYAAAPSVSQSFSVLPGTQTIAFSSLPDQAFGTPPLPLNATASSGLAIAFSSASTAVCTVSGSNVTLVSLGVCSIQASQPGNSGYSAAVPVIQTFSVIPAAPVSIGSVVNAASYTAAPLSVAGYNAVFGSSFSTTTAQATSLTLPKSLAGVTVNIADSRGTTQTAQLYYVSPTQINFLVPDGLAPGAATVTVTSSAGKKGTFATTVAKVAPSLFTADSTGTGVPAAIALAYPPGDVPQQFPVFSCADSTPSCSATPIDLGPPSTSVYLLLFGTGIRGRSGLSSVSVTLGGASLPVAFAGAQGSFAGLDQINVLLNRSLIGRGPVALQLTVDGVPANPVTVDIR